MSELPSFPREGPHYKYDTYVSSIFGQLTNMSPANTNAYHNVCIPFVTESTVFKQAGNHLNWYDWYVKDNIKSYRSSYIFNEHKLLDNPILFEFHCNELLSSGVLAKQFGAQAGGKHDDSTLINMYKESFANNNAKIELLEQMIREHDMRLPAIQKALDITKYLDEYYDIYYNSPIDKLRDSTKLSKVMLDTKGEGYDILKYIAIVPDNYTDDDLLQLYEQYPDYHMNKPDDRLHIPGVHNNTPFSNFTSEYKFIIRLTKDIVLKRFQMNLHHYTTHTERIPIRNDIRDPYKITAYCNYHYYGDDKINSFINCTFDYMLSNLEEYARTNKIDENAAKYIARLKQLQHQDYILLKFDDKGKLID